MLTPQVYGRRAREREIGRERQKSRTPLSQNKHSDMSSVKVNVSDKEWVTSSSASASSSDAEPFSDPENDPQHTPKPFKSVGNSRRVFMAEDRERTPLALKSSSSNGQPVRGATPKSDKARLSSMKSVSRKLDFEEDQSERGFTVSGMSELLSLEKGKSKELGDGDEDPPIRSKASSKIKGRKLDRGKENIPPRPSLASRIPSSDLDYISSASSSNTSSRTSSRDASPVRIRRQSVTRSASSDLLDDVGEADLQRRHERNTDGGLEAESDTRPTRRSRAGKRIDYREPGEDEIGRRPSPVRKRKVKGKDAGAETRLEESNSGPDGREAKPRKEHERDPEVKEGPPLVKVMLKKEKDQGREGQDDSDLDVHRALPHKRKPKSNSRSSSIQASSSSPQISSNQHGPQRILETNPLPRSQSGFTFNTESSLDPSPRKFQNKSSELEPQKWNDDSEDELDLIGAPSILTDPKYRSSLSQATPNLRDSQESRHKSTKVMEQRTSKPKNYEQGDEVQSIERGFESLAFPKPTSSSKTISTAAPKSRSSPPTAAAIDPRFKSLEKLLRACHPPQKAPIAFQEALDNLLRPKSANGDAGIGDRKGQVVKIGEASYSEVFAIDFSEEDGSAQREAESSGSRSKKRNDWKLGQSVLKIIPLLRPRKSNEMKEQEDGDDEKPEESDMKDVIKEITIAKELGLREGEDQNEDAWNGFGGFRGAHLVQGQYPSALLRSWKRYSSSYPKLALNPSPSHLPADQLYLILHLPFGGKDLENIKLSSWADIASIFWLTVKTLMLAEKQCKFEHRDLHWGNLLVNFKTDQRSRSRDNANKALRGDEKKHLVNSPVKRISTSFKNGRDCNSPVKSSSMKSSSSMIKKSLHAVTTKKTKDSDFNSSFNSMNQLRPTTIKELSDPTFARVSINLIDFSLSRMKCNGKVIRNDFEDPCLFEGSGDEQFQVYRDMKILTGGNWKAYHPVTNVLLAFYLPTRLLADPLTRIFVAIASFSILSTIPNQKWLNYLTAKLIHSKGLRSPCSSSSTSSKADLEVEKKAYRSLISVRKVMGEGLKQLLAGEPANMPGEALSEEPALNSAGAVWQWAEKKSWWK